ncbi:BQ2448_6535 [Microbotryum intermedium]|uniref:BQ2448_6535 protein n=1 Tax=Microbotryum intermedium TaxID=269621 RepID=A0A238FQ22_9BASI|nr:BQ2448_6535 [Microbotryum intermedium]
MQKPYSHHAWTVFTMPADPPASPTLPIRCSLSPSIGNLEEAHISELNLEPTSTQDRRKPELPIEIVRQILEEAVNAARSELFICDGVFLPITTQCSTCAYRLLAGVCTLWREVVREIFHRSVIIGERTCRDAGQSSAPRIPILFFQILNKPFNVTELVEILGKDVQAATHVRSIDASCRTKNHSLPELMPTAPATIVERYERERAADIELGQQLVKSFITLCPLLNTFDADFGHYPELLKPGLLPPSITTLTLRNVSAVETFTLLAELPRVTDLTLRIAPDWLIHEPIETCVLERYKVQLTRFELSATAWGETSVADLQLLLEHSSTTLRSLAIRNKSSFTSHKFAPVAQGLIKIYAPQLEELSVRDLSRGGSRCKEHKEVYFFLSPPVPMPRLRDLHLTGIPSSPTFFASLKCPNLSRLAIEEFDDPSGLALLTTLKSQLMPKLTSMRVCGITDKTAKVDILEWCTANGVTLAAGWRLIEIERAWWF